MIEEGTAVLAHLLQQKLVVQQGEKLLGQDLSVNRFRELSVHRGNLFVKNLGASGSLHGAGVHDLMVPGQVGFWNDKRGFPHGRDFVEASGASARHDKIAQGIAKLDVMEECAVCVKSFDFPELLLAVQLPESCLRVLQRIVIVAFGKPHAVDDEQRIAIGKQMSEGIDQGAVYCSRSLRSAENKNDLASFRDLEIDFLTGLRTVHLGDALPERVAHERSISGKG